MNRKHHSLAALLTAVSLGACADNAADQSEAIELVQSHSTITAIIARHSEQLMALEDVVAVGESICDGTPCIKVLLRKENSTTLATIPQQLEGISVVTEISGSFQANQSTSP